MDRFSRKLLIGILILSLLAPLGLILPTYIKSKTAFGEESGDSIKKELGYIPKGMRKDEKIWKAPVKDYVVRSDEKPLWKKSLIYFSSGLLGIVIIALLTILIQKKYLNHE